LDCAQRAQTFPHNTVVTVFVANKQTRLQTSLQMQAAETVPQWWGN